MKIEGKCCNIPELKTFIEQQQAINLNQQISPINFM